MEPQEYIDANVTRTRTLAPDLDGKDLGEYATLLYEAYYALVEDTRTVDGGDPNCPQVPPPPPQ